MIDAEKMAFKYAASLCVEYKRTIKSLKIAVLSEFIVIVGIIAWTIIK